MSLFIARVDWIQIRHVGCDALHRCHADDAVRAVCTAARRFAWQICGEEYYHSYYASAFYDSCLDVTSKGHFAIKYPPNMFMFISFNNWFAIEFSQWVIHGFLFCGKFYSTACFMGSGLKGIRH